MNAEGAVIFGMMFGSIIGFACGWRACVACVERIIGARPSDCRECWLEEALDEMP